MSQVILATTDCEREKANALTLLTVSGDVSANEYLIKYANAEFFQLVINATTGGTITVKSTTSVEGLMAGQGDRVYTVATGSMYDIHGIEQNRHKFTEAVVVGGVTISGYLKIVISAAFRGTIGVVTDDIYK